MSKSIGMILAIATLIISCAQDQQKFGGSFIPTQFGGSYGQGPGVNGKGTVCRVNHTGNTISVTDCDDKLVWKTDEGRTVVASLNPQFTWNVNTATGIRTINATLDFQNRFSKIRGSGTDLSVNFRFFNKDNAHLFDAGHLIAANNQLLPCAKHAALMPNIEVTGDPSQATTIHVSGPGAAWGNC